MNPLIVGETGVLFRYQYMQKQQSWKGIISGVATPKRNNTERRRHSAAEPPPTRSQRGGPGHFGKAQGRDFHSDGNSLEHWFRDGNKVLVKRESIAVQK